MSATAKFPLDNNEECPIHGGHKWGKCYENRFGENFKPPAAASSASSKDKKPVQGKKDAHALQTVEESDEETSSDNYLCHGCKPPEEEAYDLHFFDAATEMEAEHYDHVHSTKYLNTIVAPRERVLDQVEKSSRIRYVA
ncbi:MAG: hypothetical protein ACREOZ_03000 [Gloeomargaritales cyanobacterium]